MNRIDAMFKRLSQDRGKALIPYLTVGFPSVKILPKLVQALVAEGVDLMELGIPFSDPLADGPTIQAASQWALRQGVTPAGVLRAVRKLRDSKISVPIALMTYTNPVLRYGVEKFCRDCSRSGVDGLILPDLPPEEAGELLKAARPRGIDVVFLAAPTSPAPRLRRIARDSSGFIYYVSLTGVTGARASLPAEVAAHVRSIKQMTDLPVCVGFGISGAEQVREVARIADGVIVGSALLDRIRRSEKDPVRQAALFVRKLRTASRV